MNNDKFSRMCIAQDDASESLKPIFKPHKDQSFSDYFGCSDGSVNSKTKRRVEALAKKIEGYMVEGNWK